MEIVFIDLAHPLSIAAGTRGASPGMCNPGIFNDSEPQIKPDGSWTVRLDESFVRAGGSRFTSNIRGS
jgi:hypothetical protein